MRRPFTGRGLPFFPETVTLTRSNKTNGAYMWQRILSEIQEQHLALDKDIAQWLAAYTGQRGKLFCGKGCSNCCSLAVNCTFPEALNAAKALTPTQGEALRRHIERLRGLLPLSMDLKSFLKNHRQQLGHCPFLNDQDACGIYQVRPCSCRALLSTKENRWCGTDFGALSSEEKRDYVESLDRAVVSFPVHYVAMTQELGQEREIRFSRRMTTTFGFSIYGNLPVLTYLEYEHCLSRHLAQGYQATVSLLQQTGLYHPFLVMLDQ